VRLGVAVHDERHRRRLTLREVAARARLSRSTVRAIESGQVASLEGYARLASALGLTFDMVIGGARGTGAARGGDVVHSAMGEIEAKLLRARGYAVAIDHPYQHYQFAGRADILAWTLEPPALLHIENRTDFPDLQAAAGSFNTKCRYLASVLAGQLGVPRFTSQTHVMAGLWSSVVMHAVRLRPESFRAICPDGVAPLRAWLDGDPPVNGFVRTFVALDPLAAGRQRQMIDLATVLAGARPRMRDYRDAAERLHAAGMA
jgi:transcriptional regulator with XRE-family HTH domain